MDTYKASGIDFLRKQIKRAGEEKKASLIKALTESERSVWEKALSMSWISLDTANSIWIKASKIIFPDDTQDKSIYQLGLMQAKENVNTMFKLIFKVINTETIIERAAGMWRNYHQKGDAEIERLSGNAYIFHVKNYSNLPEGIAQSACGYIHGLIELAGKKNITVTRKKTSTGWDWHIRYSD